MDNLQDALEAIIARVEQRFDDPKLVPYREVITEDDSGEWTAIDCKLIAQAALGIDA